MPPLVSVIFAVLIGWPLLKLVTTIVSRGRWERQRTLRTQLDGDTRYGQLEHRIVEETFREGKGSIAQLALPFVAFFAGLALITRGPDPETSQAAQRDRAAALRKRLLQLGHPEATDITFELCRDHRFKALETGAFELQMLRYPVATIVTALAIIPSLVLIAVLYGLKLSLRSVTRRVIESSQQTVKTFATLIASTTTAR